MPLKPLAIGKSSIRRARRFLTLAGAPLDDAKVRNDLRRMAIVMAVAAVDAYTHRLVLDRVSAVRRAGELPKRLADLGVTFGDIAEIAETMVAARRVGAAARPWVKVKNALHRQTLGMTFQSADQVAGSDFCIRCVSVSSLPRSGLPIPGL